MSDETDSAGWDAITAVFARLYPGQEPRHFAFSMFGDAPLQGISAYRSTRGRPHWHMVTYGFSDLYEKEGDQPESGFGFELTFRLARGADEEDPPSWAINFLQNLARYVFRSGNPFAPGHFMSINGPIALETDTALVAALFVEDDEAGRIDTPNGSVVFVCVVGATLDEQEAARRWRTDAIVDLLRAQDPVLVTDLARTSVMTLPGNAATLAAGLETDGSNCGLVYLDVVEVAADSPHVTLGAKAAVEIQAILPYRLPFGRPFSLIGKTSSVLFMSGTENQFTRGEHGLTIKLDPSGVDELLRVLQPKRGDYRLAVCPELRITLRPTEITNPDGSIARVIG